MNIRTHAPALTAVVALLLAAAPAHAADERSLEDVRDSLADLLQSMVAKGVVTREQAGNMIMESQRRAEEEVIERERAADARREAALPAAVEPAAQLAQIRPEPVAAPAAAVSAAVAAAEAEAAQDVARGDVRVTYVPQHIRDEIREQVRAEVTPQVVQEVLAQAKTEKWGVPGALPDWVSRVRFSGDIRVREQVDMFASDNAEFAYLDFIAVNDKGGIGKAGQSAFLNTTEDRTRTRVRARVGADVKLTDSFTAGLRLATGNFRDPISTNQTLNQNSGRYTFGIDQAYLRYDARSTPDFSWLSAAAGRIANPFYSTDLVYDQDLAFEGLTGTTRIGIGSRPSRHNAYLTLGAFQLEEVESSQDDKWLYAAQSGIDWTFDNRSKLRGAVGYYHYANVTGRRNALDSTLLDYTAPKWLQKGNTLFDIRNDADPATNLFALAADYQVLDVILGYEMPVMNHYQLAVLANYANNLGYDEQEVMRRIGTRVDARTEGYLLEVAFGHPKVDRAGAWRASARYRYLQRDAVLDAFTDSDFHLGGTDAQGYALRADYGLATNVWLSARYLSANEIDGPPLGIDVLMLDLNGAF